MGSIIESEINSLVRSALVIGINDYADEPLVNPVNDATAMSKALDRLHFSPQLHLNVNKHDLDKYIDQWVATLNNVDVAIFYFSGHGAEIKGSNYIYPTDAVFSTNENVVANSTCLVSDLLKKMESTNVKICILILDACRFDPTKSVKRSFTKKGMKSMGNLKRGVLVAFPVAAGETTLDGQGSNSLYTQAVLDNIEIPGIPIKKIFGKIEDDVFANSGKKQTPFTNESIGEENNFCLKYGKDISKGDVKAYFGDSSVTNDLKRFKSKPDEGDFSVSPDTAEAIFVKAQSVLSHCIDLVIDSLGGKSKYGQRNTGQGADYINLTFEREDGIVRSHYYNIYIAPITKVHLTSNEFAFSISDGLYPEIARFVEENGIKTERPLVMSIKNIDWDSVAESIVRYFFIRKDFLKDNPKKILGIEN